MCTLNERLKEERTRLGLTQDEFAEKGGIKRRAQANYESGERCPDGHYYEAIAKIGVDIHYILTGIRSQQATNITPPNYVDLNKKKIDKLMENLTAEQQAELIKLAEEKQRINWYEVELEELKKRVVG